MQNKKKGAAPDVLKVLSPVVTVLFLFGLLIAVIDLTCFDKAFYAREYAKLDTAASMGMRKADLDTAMDALLQYLLGERDDLLVYAKVDGKVRAVFNEREIQHMQDVRALYRGGTALGYGMLAVGTVFFAWALGKRERQKKVLSGYIRGNLVFLVILGAVALFATIDFDTFWTMFHQMVFTNDLWLLDPGTDLLIRMVPQQFFFDLVLRIALFSLGIVGLLLAGAAVWKKRLHMREGGEQNHEE